MINYEKIKAKWNFWADKNNQWDDLGEDEKIEFAIETIKEEIVELCHETKRSLTSGDLAPRGVDLIIGKINKL